MTYLEENDFGTREPDEHQQDALHFNAIWQYAFWEPYLILTTEVDNTSAISVETDVSEPVNLIETIFKGTFYLPLMFNDRISLGFTGSYNILYNLNRTSEFTMENNFTIMGYPELNFYPTGYEEDYNLSFYANYSLVNVRTERLDTTFGIRLFIPFYGKRIKYPLYAYQKGITFRLEYNNISIVLPLADDQNFEFTIRRLMASVGFSF